MNAWLLNETIRYLLKGGLLSTIFVKTSVRCLGFYRGLEEALTGYEFIRAGEKWSHDDT